VTEVFRRKRRAAQRRPNLFLSRIRFSLPADGITGFRRSSGGIAEAVQGHGRESISNLRSLPPPQAIENTTSDSPEYTRWHSLCQALWKQGCGLSGGIEEGCAQLIGEASCGRRRVGRARHRRGELAHGPRLGGGGHIEARGDRRPGDGVFACDERGRVGSPAFPRQ